MRAYERLINYVTYDTTSAEGADSTPSTPGQPVFARILVDELRELGLADAHLSDECYVYATLPASPGLEGAEALGLIAHMDTAPDFSGTGVRPRFIADYDGGDVALGEGRTLRVSDFPHLAGLRGQTLITASGSTLLGADDKAGIAEIMTLLDELRFVPHGPLAICFTPDEEVGNGVLNFDMEQFPASAAFTVDGGPLGELSWENFNAASARVSFAGVNVHPGSAYGIMVNAARCAAEFDALLPGCDTPRDSTGREGYFYLTSISGDTSKAESRYNLRDFSLDGLREREELIRRAARVINERYGEGTASVTFREGYRNMREKLLPDHAQLIEHARRAMRECGVEPVEVPVRGGTDGAELSWMGLPCPNLCTGGYAFHGPNEHITAEAMDKCVEILRRLVDIYSAR